MTRGSYSQGKRQREAERARKKRIKAEKRMERRQRGPGEVEITTQEEMMGDVPTIDEAMRMMEERASAPRRAGPVPCRLFVGGLSWNLTDVDLRTAFSEFGDVSDAVVVTDRDSGKSRGFGFVTMADRKDAARAVQGLNDTELDGRSIVVNVATESQR